MFSLINLTEYQDTSSNRYRDTGIKGYKYQDTQLVIDTGIQEYRDTGILHIRAHLVIYIQGYKNTGIQNIRTYLVIDTRIQEYKDTGIHGYRISGHI